MRSRAEKAQNQRYYRHGLSKLKAGVTRLGSRAIDGRSKLAYSLKAWRNEIIADLGGEENVTVQQRTIIECAAMTKMMVNSLDAWIVERESLVTINKSVLPVVMQRQSLANSLVSMMSQLGLKRVEKPVPTLDEIKAEILAENNNGNGSESQD